jgi:hypothetical protein
MPYDRADHDYSTEGERLPKGHAATHIGMFLAWAAQHQLLNDFHEQRSATLVAQLRNRQITGRQFFERACREQFAEKDLNVEGNAFAEQYYRSLDGERGAYFEDYKKILTTSLPSFWHVSDSWENYDKIARVVTRRYEQWKNPPKKRWWQFWK